LNFILLDDLFGSFATDFSSNQIFKQGLLRHSAENFIFLSSIILLLKHAEFFLSQADFVALISFLAAINATHLSILPVWGLSTLSWTL